MIRTRVFVYEHLTGGGLLESPVPLSPSLVREGRAMISALAEDLASLPEVEVLMLDAPGALLRELPAVRTIAVTTAEQRDEQFTRSAGTSDWTLVIAPETGGTLTSLAERVLAVGGRLLGPPPRVVALASDKHALARHLEYRGVPVPAGIALESLEQWPPVWDYPAVLKPRDGCGSLGVRLVEARPGLRSIARGLFGVGLPEQQLAALHRGHHAGALALGGESPDGGKATLRAIEDEAEALRSIAPRGWLLERFCAGLPASVAIVCGPGGHHALEPCRQLLSADGRFVYQGGMLPLPTPLAARARQLALRAVGTLEGCLGYVGVDLVLGPHAEQDVVIEINTRLTTSYIGLRHAYAENLAAALLAVAEDEPCKLTPQGRPLAFESDGTVRLG